MSEERRADEPVFSHLDKDGKARMVDVTEKKSTVREAVARGRVVMSAQTLSLIQGGALPKGDVLGVAKVAAVMAAKKTGELIPMCHPLELTGIEVTFLFDTDRNEIIIETRVKTVGRTGVEMEAMTAAAVAALTIYDMCKSADREMKIAEVMLVAKRGGKSGTYERAGAP
jgi:cyclic pyranopterin monophosphate synthase